MSSWVPSAANLHLYADDGVAVFRDMLTSDDILALQNAWQELKEQISSGEAKRADRFVQGKLPPFLENLYRHDSFVTAAKAILGTENLALFMNRILLKDGSWNGEVAIHQDYPYFLGGQTKLSIFVPLAPTAAKDGNGGLIFVRGSHKYGALQRGTIRREKFPPMEEIAPELVVGDVVLMDFLTWHYSEKAVIHSDRPLLQIVYQSSTDGSYGSAQLGVPEPTLVSGQWLTKHYAAFNESTIPDGVTP